MAAAQDGLAARLFAAARDGNEAATRRLLRSLVSEGSSLSTRAVVDHPHGADGITPLYAACRGGATEVARALLMSGAAVSTSTLAGGFCPLWIAAREGKTKCVELLLSERGIVVDQAAKDGRTPLYVACESGRLECAAALLRHGAGLEAKRADGSTPLIVAACFGREDMVRLLLDAGCDLVPRDGDGTALENARRQGHGSITAMLETAAMERRVAAEERLFQAAELGGNALLRAVEGARRAGVQEALIRRAAGGRLESLQVEAEMARKGERAGDGDGAMSGDGEGFALARVDNSGGGGEGGGVGSSFGSLGRRDKMPPRTPHPVALEAASRPSRRKKAEMSVGEEGEAAASEVAPEMAKGSAAGGRGGAGGREGKGVKGERVGASSGGVTAGRRAGVSNGRDGAEDASAAGRGGAAGSGLRMQRSPVGRRGAAAEAKGLRERVEGGAAECSTGVDRAAMRTVNRNTPAVNRDAMRALTEEQLEALLQGGRAAGAVAPLVMLHREEQQAAAWGGERSEGASGGGGAQGSGGRVQGSGNQEDAAWRRRLQEAREEEAWREKQAGREKLAGREEEVLGEQAAAATTRLAGPPEGRTEVRREEGVVAVDSASAVANMASGETARAAAVAAVEDRRARLAAEADLVASVSAAAALERKMDDGRQLEMEAVARKKEVVASPEDNRQHAMASIHRDANMMHARVTVLSPDDGQQRAMEAVARKMEAATREERRGLTERVAAEAEEEETLAGVAARKVGGGGKGGARATVARDAKGGLNVSRNVATLDDVMASVGIGQGTAAVAHSRGEKVKQLRGLVGGRGGEESGSGDEGEESDDEELIDPAALRREMLREGSGWGR
jgi:hypothetical protein